MLRVLFGLACVLYIRSVEVGDGCGCGFAHLMQAFWWSPHAKVTEDARAVTMRESVAEEEESGPLHWHYNGL
jgi:hypothetical protein